MDEQSLLAYAFGGGDIDALSPEDLRKLRVLLSPEPPPGSQAGAMAQSTVQGDPSRQPSFNFTRPGTPVSPSADTSALADIPPEEFLRGLGSTGLQGLMLATGLAPGMPLVARTLINLILGGAEGVVRPGGDVQEGAKAALFQGGLEGISGGLSKGFPRLGTEVAVRTGVPASARASNEASKMVRAQLRRRQREGIGMTPAPGRTRSLAAWAQGKKPRQEQ